MSAKTSELASRVEHGVDHFKATMGLMPVQMKTLSEQAPEVFNAYLDMRTWLMKEPSAGGHMPLKYKHLIFLVIDIAYGNQLGAENHGRAALRQGLTLGELKEAMVQLLMTGGVGGCYGRTGYLVWDTILASPEAKTAAK